MITWVYRGIPENYGNCEWGKPTFGWSSFFFPGTLLQSSSTKVSSTSLDAVDAPSGIEFQDLDPLAGTIQGPAIFGDMISAIFMWKIHFF